MMDLAPCSQSYPNFSPDEIYKQQLYFFAFKIIVIL